MQIKVWVLIVSPSTPLQYTSPVPKRSFLQWLRIPVRDFVQWTMYDKKLIKMSVKLKCSAWYAYVGPSIHVWDIIHVWASDISIHSYTIVHSYSQQWAIALVGSIVPACMHRLYARLYACQWSRDMCFPGMCVSCRPRMHVSHICISSTAYNS